MKDRAVLKKIADKLKKNGKKIVTINGTFDILHPGHEYILKEAKKQGDVLIVGINSDTSVKSNKGQERPLNNQLNRAKLMANYPFVDYVTIFTEKSPLKLLELIKPDIHVNGSEYGEDCIEAETVKKQGGKIYIIQLLKGYSTTGIIKREIIK
ncbi:adenylyltransferase/cytidyltransferase family protein [Candidatus Woesearchaeota archaeon]|nr:adenylyltransferase/cytidyltransferase family protein [Candidatus Woesearchaeota archaeon]